MHAKATHARLAARRDRGTFQRASRGSRRRSVVPSSLTIMRNLTPDLRSAHIAAHAERHTCHCAPARSSASREDPMHSLSEGYAATPTVRCAPPPAWRVRGCALLAATDSAAPRHLISP
jgi:hypothetical protein